MPPRPVRVSYIVDLEAERVLQVVARLLRVQPGHHSRPSANLDDLHAACLRQRLGGLPELVRRRHTVRARAQLTLAGIEKMSHQA